jgi:hypothetical protein
MSKYAYLNWTEMSFLKPVGSNSEHLETNLNVQIMNEMETPLEF